MKIALVQHRMLLSLFRSSQIVLHKRKPDKVIENILNRGLKLNQQSSRFYNMTSHYFLKSRISMVKILNLL